MQGQTIAYTYYPYGEEYTTTTQDTDKFGTYFRDSTTALDYARNRYYSNRLARFLTADPYRASGGPADPGSWNRYAYVQSDPVNFRDSQGLFMSSAGGGESPADGGSGGGGGVDPSLFRFVSHFSPTRTTAPKRPRHPPNVYKKAKDLQKAVRDGEETDCEALADFADAMAQGDLSQDVRPHSEQDRLGVALRTMIASLRELILQVQVSARALAESSGQLGGLG